MEARATEIHRWDLTERSDNPGVSVHAKGTWDLRSNEAAADEIKVDLPHSNLRGTGKFGTNAQFPWSAQIKSAALEVQDILAWYRASSRTCLRALWSRSSFRARELCMAGRCIWDNAHLTSSGGALHIPGIAEPVRIGAVHGDLQRNAFVVQPVRISASGGKAGEAANAKTEKAAGHLHDVQNWAELRFVLDSTLKNGAMRVDGHLDQPELYFKTAAALGKTINHGWGVERSS